MPVEGAPVAAPFAENAAKNFQLETQTRVEVTRSDTDTALSRLCAGTIPVGLADRPATEEELAGCERNEIELVRVPLGHHAVAVARNEDLPIRCLALRDLGRLWRPGSAIERWGQLRRRLPATPVVLHAAPPGSADSELFSMAVLGSEGRLRPGYGTVDSYRAFLDAVGAAPGAGGFFNFEQIRQGTGGDVELVAVDEGDGCVEPTPASVQSGSYGALARPVYMYVSRPALERYRSVRSFARYAVEDYRQQILVTPSLVPATEAELAAALRDLPDAPVPSG